MYLSVEFSNGMVFYWLRSEHLKQVLEGHTKQYVSVQLLSLTIFASIEFALSCTCYFDIRL